VDLSRSSASAKFAGTLAYLHPRECDRALSRRATGGAWFSRVPREKRVRRCLWLKFRLTNLMATSSFVLMFVPIQSRNVKIFASEVGVMSPTMVDVTEGATSELS
jgi:hypothetical protein